MATTVLKDVEIMKSGAYIEGGAGRHITITDKDLQAYAENFKGGNVPIPLKLGHTSDKHIEKVADSLGITIEILNGENGVGTPKLGKIINLNHVDGHLLSDIELANSKVYGLFSEGFFDSFSVETVEDYQLNPEKSLGKAIVGLSALGADTPAIFDLPELKLTNGQQVSKIYLSRYHMTTKTPDEPKVDEKSLIEKLSAIFDDKIKGMFEKKDEDDDLDENGKKKVKKSKDEDSDKMSKDLYTKQIASFQKSLDEANQRISLSAWQAKTVTLDKVAGKPEDLAAELSGIELSAGLETAEKLFAAYESQNTLMDKYGLAKSTLDPEGLTDNPDEIHPFEKNVDEFAKTNKLNKYQALAQYSTQNKEEYVKYRREMQGVK